MADELVTVVLEGEQSAVEELHTELDKVANTRTKSGEIEQWDGEGAQLVNLAVQIAPIAIPAVSGIIMALIRRRRPGEIRGISINGTSITAKELDADGLAKIMREMNQKAPPPKK
ncbi:hypothetical protein [Bradyrhizobium cajani]|uniref:Uncharacterized protein n=1 Tax=Bradyrhizobium cajani TaxID=1928661 RepID=A0A844T7T3_9BRAD|nr:hypothetical protein [Bradyrhizobium cajani]MCP3370664.1 hypothetical protein [Bradyrhizobium cajani]MVT75183.1 hypothetical protein [Bradyrhizobium cajani]